MHQIKTLKITRHILCQQCKIDYPDTNGRIDKLISICLSDMFSRLVSYNTYKNEQFTNWLSQTLRPLCYWVDWFEAEIVKCVDNNWLITVSPICNAYHMLDAQTNEAFMSASGRVTEELMTRNVLLQYVHQNEFIKERFEEICKKGYMLACDNLGDWSAQVELIEK